MSKDGPPTTSSEDDEAAEALRAFERELAMDDLEALVPATDKGADIEIDPLADDFAGFDDALRRSPVVIAPAPAVVWPKPWEALATAAPERTPRHAGPWAAPSFKKMSSQHREFELVGRAGAIGADVAYHAEKVTGVPARIAHRADEPFPVIGLDRIAILLEAVLQIQQGALDPAEVLAMGTPRRAISPLGRGVPEGHGVAVDRALKAAVHDDDHTAADLLGWRLGWREIQQHLPAFGLAHHTMILPARVRFLAFTNLPGPLAELSLEARIELWRELSEDDRRSFVGEIYKTNLDTELDVLTDAFLDVAEDPLVTWETKTRWALALGPRGCASEYGALVASLFRGQVLSPAHSQMAVAALKPCAGDFLSGAGHGEVSAFGKLGQTFGALGGAGVVVTAGGGEAAVCLLAKNIRTADVGGLVEELRELSSLLVTYVLNA